MIKFEEKMGIKVDWIGRDYKFSLFSKYRIFFFIFLILFSFLYVLLNLRVRIEVMLCGMVLVMINFYGESEYIVNGENGYVFNNMFEFYEYLKFFYYNLKEVRRIGYNFCNMVKNVFYIDKFIV